MEDGGGQADRSDGKAARNKLDQWRRAGTQRQRACILHLLATGGRIREGRRWVT